MRRVTIIVLSLGLIAVAAVVATNRGRGLLWAMYTQVRGRASVEDRVAEFGPRARVDLEQWCLDAGLSYPPDAVAIVALKDERVLQIHARSDGPDTGWRHLHTYPILGASGAPGPKLIEGDRQVPEGIYPIESLNPNSRFHLSLRVGYPNRADVERGRADGRQRLGGDIMIHGGNASIGCIAIGDDAIERLFVLAADVGVEQIRVVIVPEDLRRRDAVEVAGGIRDAPGWLPELYRELAEELEGYAP